MESLIEKTSAFSLKLQEDAVNALVGWNLALAKEVQERAGEAQRHYRVMIRQVALASLSRTIADKIGVRNCQENITFALVARDTSRLVYHSSQIAGHVLKLGSKRKVNSEILRAFVRLSEVAYEMQMNATTAFLKKDARLAVKVLTRMNEIRIQEEVLLKSIMGTLKDVDTAVTLSMITRDLRRIAGYTVAIADDAMNRVLTPLIS